jgi:GTP-binding protein EngB required for normal cell division
MVSFKKNSDATYEIVFVGRSNVGKSSLIQSLTGFTMKRGRRPGITLKPKHLYFGDIMITDMPGFGFMSGVKERKQDIVKTKFVRYIEKYRNRIILAVLVLDGKSFSEVVDRWTGRGEIPIEVEMFDFLQELDMDVVVAVNKMDKIRQTDTVMDNVAERLGMLPPWRQWPDMLVVVSAKKGDVKKLADLIRNRIHSLARDDLLGWIQ